MGHLAWAATVVSICGLVAAGCRREEALAGDEAGRIEEALRWLLEHGGPDSFVIIEEPRTTKFAQFAGSRKEPLLLDLPSQALDDAEMARAKTLFAELGVEGPEEWDVYDPFTGQVAGKQVGFLMAFGRDAPRAAATTWRIFREVYRFPADTALAVTRHKE